MGSKTIVISGGTDGMGRATALARRERGDTVVVIGSNEAKGRTLGPGITFLRADLSSIAAVRAVVSAVAERHGSVDALVLCANRQSPARRETAEGLEYTFGLYYLSRYLLTEGLRPQLEAAPAPVIINVAGVGVTKGAIAWDDLQLRTGYGMIRAQLQAGRLNDLLGAGYTGKARYVLYHPGFTRSGDLSPLSPPLRLALRALARVAARPVAASIGPIVELIDQPPAARLTALDRGRVLDPSLPTLDPAAATRLRAATEALLATVPGR
ncbi:SDR family NAD(P)-dependent oxidoreductase [Dactylosporangium sp. CS-047395]|uniref:SDR family NAD(P)-dependent oxidoreductase n=1 Tax=Dactylosporangium sp. CS-047395 TaxID=3239936 RepID=UPI003D944680